MTESVLTGYSKNLPKLLATAGLPRPDYEYVSRRTGLMTLPECKEILMLNKRKILDSITQGIIEIRLHGRGGQGVVIASKILAKAFHSDGYTPQTFPKYGVERRGAPAAAFVRVVRGHDLIGLRCEIYEPDHLIVLDPTLLLSINVTQGLKRGGWIIINDTIDSASTYGELTDQFRVALVDATKIALHYRLGSKTSPVVNSAILGGFAKIFDRPSIGSVLQSIKDEVPIKTEENAAAAQLAFDQIEVIGE